MNPVRTPARAAASTWLAGLALSFAVPAAWGHEPASQRVLLEQKIRLAATLIADSPTAQRIAASADTAAKAHLDEGRVHHALAQDLLSRGDLPGAQQAIDDALRHIGMARRLVPDAPARLAAARLRYEQQFASLERLIDAWRGRIGASPRGDDASDLTLAMGLLSDARDLGRAGRLDDANARLAQAERHVLDGMNRLLHAVTLDYTPRFAGPADEFQHELARHGDLAELVPLALNDLRPAATARALIERYTETSRSLRAEAIAQFQGGDPQQALAHLRNASSYLERALAAAGVVAPQSTGSSP